MTGPRVSRPPRREPNVKTCFTRTHSDRTVTILFIYVPPREPASCVCNSRYAGALGHRRSAVHAESNVRRRYAMTLLSCAVPRCAIPRTVTPCRYTRRRRRRRRLYRWVQNIKHYNFNVKYHETFAVQHTLTVKVKNENITSLRIENNIL